MFGGDDLIRGPLGNGGGGSSCGAKAASVAAFGCLRIRSKTQMEMYGTELEWNTDTEKKQEIRFNVHKAKVIFKKMLCMKYRKYLFRRRKCIDGIYNLVRSHLEQLCRYVVRRWYTAIENQAQVGKVLLPKTSEENCVKRDKEKCNQDILTSLDMSLLSAKIMKGVFAACSLHSSPLAIICRSLLAFFKTWDERRSILRE